MVGTVAVPPAAPRPAAGTTLTLLVVVAALIGLVLFLLRDTPTSSDPASTDASVPRAGVVRGLRPMIFGRVTRGARPAVGRTVTVCAIAGSPSAGAQSVETDADGRYQVEVGDGSFVVELVPKDPERARMLRGDDPAEMRVTATVTLGGYDVERDLVEPSGSLALTVHQRDGLPAAGCEVVLCAGALSVVEVARGVTDARGELAFSDLDAGMWRLEAAAPLRRLVGGTRIRVVAERFELRAEALLRPAGGLVLAVSEDGGQPYLEQLATGARFGPDAGQHGSGGVWRIGNLPPGPFALRRSGAALPEQAEASVELSVDAGVWRRLVLAERARVSRFSLGGSGRARPVDEAAPELDVWVWRHADPWSRAPDADLHGVRRRAVPDGNRWTVPGGLSSGRYTVEVARADGRRWRTTLDASRDPLLAHAEPALGLPW